MPDGSVKVQSAEGSVHVFARVADRGLNLVAILGRRRARSQAHPYTGLDMGMTGGLYQASALEIRKLVEDPRSIEAFVEASAWAPPVREVRPKGVLGWLMRLSPVRVFENDPDAAPPPDYDPLTDRPHCDLEGVWHGLHFLFTGTAWEGDEPACYLIRGGEEIGDADESGYSVLQALSPAKVQRFSAFLHGLSRDELERRFDAARMTALEIHPGGWNRGVEGNERPRDRLLDGYDELRAFVDAAVEAKAGAVAYVS